MKVNKVDLEITLDPAKLSTMVTQIKAFLTTKKASGDILYAKGAIRTVEEPETWSI